QLRERVDVPAAERRVADAGDAGNARERVPEGGPAEPGDDRELRMRRPEALGAGGADPSVLEHAGHRVAELERDGGRPRSQIADAGAATAAADRAVERRVDVGRATDAREQPAGGQELLDGVAARIQAGLGVRLAAHQREADVPGTGGDEAEAR